MPALSSWGDFVYTKGTNKHNMPINLTEQQVDYGQVYYEWDFPEYTRHERSLTWYIVAGIVVLGFLLYAFFTANILFVVLTIMVVVILLFVQQREPRTMHIKITDEGLVIENRLFAYDEIRSFWVVYELPDIRNVYFEFKSVVIPRLVVPYGDLDPNRLRAFLQQYIEVDDEREGVPVSEVVSRWLRL